MSSTRTFAPGSGDITVTLGDQELVLRPSLDAALTLSRQAGGIRLAINKVLDMDLDTIVAVIRLGVGREEAKRLKNLDRLIYENGLLDAQGELVTRCIEYLSNLARGGRPADAIDEQDGGGDTSADPTTKQQLN